MAGRSSAEEGFDSTRTYECANHREALRALGTRVARAGGSGRKALLAARSNSAPRNEGDARGTRKRSRAN